MRMIQAARARTVLNRKCLPLMAAVAAALFLALFEAAEPATPADGLPPSETGISRPAFSPLHFGELPFISLQPVPAYGVAPLTVGFLVNEYDPQGVGFVRYQWNFGDGNVSTLPPIFAYETFKAPGAYTVTLIAATADGRSASALAGVVVKPAALR